MVKEWNGGCFEFGVVHTNSVDVFLLTVVGGKGIISRPEQAIYLHIKKWIVGLYKMMNDNRLQQRKKYAIYVLCDSNDKVYLGT